jgi:hypothetical protein
MDKRYSHITHHAHKHQEAEKRLKKLISQYNPTKEKIFPVFITTFIIVLLSLLLFRHWGTIISLFRSEPAQEEQTIDTNGIKTGIKSVYGVDHQAGMDYKKTLDATMTTGSVSGAEVNMAFGADRGEEPASLGYTFKQSAWVTNYLSTGQFLTKLNQKNAKVLQKSILATYYLGEKTVDINSILELDSKILSQIKNALSIDLFQYLNQATNRSDSLDEYLHLLEVLLEKTDERINDLQYKISFLTLNVKSNESQLKTSEQAFFDNMKIFDGPNAEQQLGKFVGVQSDQAEAKAKLGAYKSLQDYYKFFKPKIDNLIKSIEANRSALIAGVKVVEIQNMSLPLIIKGK